MVAGTRSRTKSPTDMHCDEEMALVVSQAQNEHSLTLAPTGCDMVAIPDLPPLDFGELARQLPDISSLDSFSLTIQQQAFYPVVDNSGAMMEMAHNAEDRMQ